MSFWLFATAGLLSAIWLVIHLTLGQRDIARPLLRASDLDKTVCETQYLCWHFTSVSIACMSGFFGAAALYDMDPMGVAGTLLAIGFAICGIGLVTARGASHVQVPQGWLFLPVAALGFFGLLA